MYIFYRLPTYREYLFHERSNMVYSQKVPVKVRLPGRVTTAEAEVRCCKARQGTQGDRGAHLEKLNLIRGSAHKRRNITFNH